MLSLEKLKECGALAAHYSSVDFQTASVVSISEMQSKSKEEQSSYKGAVIVDDATWVATKRSQPIESAAFVYSGNATVVGKWRADANEFRILYLNNNTLSVKQIVKFERSMSTMADQNAKDLMKKFQEQGAKAGKATEQPQGNKPLDAFDNNGEQKQLTPDEIKKLEQKAEREQKKKDEQERYNKIVSATEGVHFKQFDAAVAFNRDLGRVLGYVTASDEAIKLSAKKTPKSVNGKNVPIEGFELNAPKSVKEKYALKGIITNKEWADCDYNLEWSQAKPGAIKAIVFKVPVAGDFELTALQGEGELAIDKSNTAMKIKLLATADGQRYIKTHFNGSIREDASIYGKEASVLHAETRPVTKKDSEGNVTTKVGITLKIEKVGNRKGILTKNNFFPIKTYQTIPQQDLTAEQAKSLNYHVTAALKDSGKRDNLNATSQEKISLSDKGEYSSVWFKEGDVTPIAVTSCYDKTQEVTDVRIPVRIEHTGNSGKTYKFAYNELSSENGPFSVPRFQEVFKHFGVSEDNFKEFVASLQSRSNKSGNSNEISRETFVGLIFGHTKFYDGPNSIDMNESFNQFNFNVVAK